MLLQLVIQEPGAAGAILGRTPGWVWGLLAALLWLGASQLRPRTAGLWRTALMPLALTSLSVHGLVAAFGSAGHAAMALVTWAAVAGATTALALRLRPCAATGTAYEARARRFQIPGSPLPLALILGVFLTRYLVGVELALQPALAREPGFALQIGVLYGAFTGIVMARLVRLWQLAGIHAQAAASTVIS